MSRGAGATLHRLAALACTLAGTATFLMAAEPGPAITVGLGGVHRTGFWTPIVVPPAAHAGTRVRAWVDDADGQLVGSPPTSLAADAPFCVRPGRPAARLVIAPAGQGGDARALEVAAAGRGEEMPGATVPSTTPLVLVLGDLPAAAAAVQLVAGERKPMQVVRLSDGPVPARLAPRDLDAFDVAIVCGRRLPAIAADVVTAIDGWTRAGGQLVYVAGASAEAVARAGGVAAEWLPATGVELVPLRRFGGLEVYARSGGLAGKAPPGGVRVPRFTRPTAGPPAFSGSVEAFEGSRDELPLVIRRGHGFGTITWLGLDIDEPWCAAWPGCDRLVAALLGGRSEADGGLVTPETGRARVPDLAGQLRVALDNFPAADGAPPASGVPFEVIAGLGMLYVLALYPLDWWLVSRSGRPVLSWITLPLLALGFTGVAWGLGTLWGRDAPPRCHAAELLDVDAASGLVRGAAWLAVRSPANATLDLTVAADPRVAGDFDAAVSWFADSGRGFGGVDALTPHPSLAAAEYAYGESLAELIGVPVAAASSRLFEAGWTGRSPRPVATSTLVRESRGLLAGTVAHHLPFPLARCRLLHGGWLYDAGDLAPGEAFDTDLGRGPRSLAADLTKRPAADRSERWDTASTDVARIIEVAGFHAATGGSGYTGLDAGRLARLDLAPLLDVDRAVLVGVAPAACRGTTWKVRLTGDRGGDQPLDPGAADGGSLVRIVIPLPPARGPQADPVPEAP
jgi:hypothetical protein